MKRLLLVPFLVLLSASFSFAQDFLELVKTATAEQVRAALAGGAKVDARAYDLSTPLMLAAGSNPDPAVISVLLDAGAKLDDKDWNHQTATIHVGSNPNPEVVVALLKAGANVNDRDDKGVTPILYAVTMNFTAGAPGVVQTLLKAGANVDDVDNNGFTPLMLAAWVNRNPNVVDVLLKAGANARLKSNNGKTALDYAASNLRLKGATEVYKALRAASQ